MDVSALLAQYLSVKSQINYYQLESTKWANLHENMSAMLAKQTTAEGKWESSSGQMYDDLTGTGKAINISDPKINKASDQAWGSAPAQRSAEAYAYKKVPKYDPEKLEEYAELDINYETMQTTYETLLEGLNAQAETLKTQLGNAAKDTGMIEG